MKNMSKTNKERLLKWICNYLRQNQTLQNGRFRRN